MVAVGLRPAGKKEGKRGSARCRLTVEATAGARQFCPSILSVSHSSQLPRMDAIVAKLNQERHGKDEAAERIRRALPTYLSNGLAQHLSLPMPMHAGAMPEGPTWKRKHLHRSAGISSLLTTHPSFTPTIPTRWLRPAATR